MGGRKVRHRLPHKHFCSTPLAPDQGLPQPRPPLTVPGLSLLTVLGLSLLTVPGLSVHGCSQFIVLFSLVTDSQGGCRLSAPHSHPLTARE